MITTLDRKCKHCRCDLTTENAAKKNKKYYRNECKKCRSKQVSSSFAGNKKRQMYMREYVRRKGIVKQYPCEYCSKLCYKKYRRAFCSDKCRFLSYVTKTDTCWLWKGGKNRRGYGKFCFRGYKTCPAHRVAHILFIGDIPEGMFVCHTCDNPSCVCPKHLWIGTAKDNFKDMVNKGRYRHWRGGVCNGSI